MQDLIQYQCPSCQASITQRSNESILFVCDQCNHLIDKSQKVFEFKQDDTKKIYTNVLQLGDIYKHNDIEFLLTGVIVKSEVSDPHAIWTEYVFTNPEYSNIYLSDYNGHWNIIEYEEEELPNWQPKDAVNGVIYKEDYYTLFHQYKIDILYAAGEFNFDFLLDGGKRAFEFINPPGLILVEYDENTKTNTRFFSTYLYRSEVNQNLKRKVKLPRRIGIVGSQPFKYDIHLPNFRIASVILIGLFLCLQFTYKYIYPDLSLNKAVVNTSIDNSNEIHIPNIKIPYDHAIMDIEIECDQLDNDWAALQFALINDGNGEEKYFDMEAEHYHGYEGGESWSEGSRSASGSVTRLDKGNYHFEIKPMQQAGVTPKEFEIKIGVYKASWSVFWTLTILLVIINIVLQMMMGKFEADKWGEDYFTTSDT